MRSMDLEAKARSFKEVDVSNQVLACVRGKKRGRKSKEAKRGDDEI
jgi:hypothetical protein